MTRRRKRDFAGAFEVGQPGLEGDPVGGGQAELEDFFAGDDAFAAGDGGGEAVEHGGLAGLGAAGDDDVQPGGDGGFEEGGGGLREGAEGDEFAEAYRGQHEPADVDGPVAAGDVGDDDVQPGAVGQGGVDERLGQVEPAAAGHEHPLDEIADLLVAEDGGGQFADAAAGDEDPAGFVDPQLFDGGVVEVGLQGPELGRRPGRLAYAA